MIYKFGPELETNKDGKQFISMATELMTIPLASTPKSAKASNRVM